MESNALNGSSSAIARNSLNITADCLPKQNGAFNVSSVNLLEKLSTINLENKLCFTSVFNTRDPKPITITHEEISKKYEEFDSLATQIEQKFNALVGFHVTKIQTENKQNNITSLLELKDIKYSLGQLKDTNYSKASFTERNKIKSLYERDKLKKIQVFNLSSILKKSHSEDSGSGKPRLFSQIPTVEASHALNFDLDKELVKNLDYLELLNQIRKVAKYGDNLKENMKTLDDINEDFKDLNFRSKSIAESEPKEPNYALNSSIFKIKNFAEANYKITEVEEETQEDFLIDKSKNKNRNSEVHNSNVQRLQHISILNCNQSDTASVHSTERDDWKNGLVKKSSVFLDEEVTRITKKNSTVKFPDKSSGLEAKFISLLTSDLNDKQFIENRSKEILRSKDKKKSPFMTNILKKHQLSSLTINNDISTNINSGSSGATSDFQYINEGIRKSVANSQNFNKVNVELPGNDHLKEAEISNQINYYKQYRSNINNDVATFSRETSKPSTFYPKFNSMDFSDGSTSLKQMIHKNVEEDTYTIMENIQIERQLEREMNLLKEEKERLDKKINEVYSSINGLRDKIEVLKSDNSFLFLLKDRQETELNQMILQASTTVLPIKGHKKDNKRSLQIDNDKYMQDVAELKKKFFRFMKSFEEKVAKNNATMNQNEEMLKLKKEEVYLLLQKLEIVKYELANSKNTLLLYYHKILSIGTDVRKIGLQWIIMAIWKLDSNVVISYVPNHFDKEHVIYLFLTSHMLIIVELLKALLHEIKLYVKDAKRLVGKSFFHTKSPNSQEKVEDKYNTVEASRTTRDSAQSAYLSNSVGKKKTNIDQENERKSIMNLIQLNSAKYLPEVTSLKINEEKKHKNLVLSHKMENGSKQSSKQLDTSGSVKKKYKLSFLAHSETEKTNERLKQIDHSDQIVTVENISSHISSYETSQKQKHVHSNLHRLVDLIVTVESVISRINNILCKVKKKEVERNAEVLCSNFRHNSEQNHNLLKVFRGLFGLSYQKEYNYIVDIFDKYTKNLQMCSLQPG